ncbi:ATP-binding protein [Bacillus tianshenii]|nr:ATP-binding protein [Bacillus tianshenii]
MKIGLKTRLVIAFLTIILVPIFVTIGMLYFYSSSFEQKAAGQNEQQIEQLFSEVKAEVRRNIQYIDNEALFFEKISSLLNRYEIGLKIKSAEDKLLFDSGKFSPNEKETNRSLLPDMSQLLQVRVETGEGEFVQVDIIANSLEVEPFRQFQHMLQGIFVSLAAGVIALLVLIVGWTWYISRTVLQPIKEIYTATEEMREGNLDYPISYSRNDEIGRFINGFNLMRTHLKESLKKQKQYEQSRKQLIANISHDLRTPLASIKGYVEGLLDGVVRDEEKQTRYLQVIQTKSEQLDRLIEDLFEFSKLELEQLPVEKMLIDSAEFFSEVLYDAKMDARQHKVELDIFEPIPSVCLYIDPQRIQQVLTNLIDNAIRYGSTRIDVSMNVHEGNLNVEIIDNGSGIAKEDLPFVFNRFYRGEKSRSRKSGGTGLGLAISKSIIQAHQGTIDVSSIKEEGSIFTFTLPCNFQ